ncbi:hypothetical protein M5X11_19135 [Paenibacillus alginolyticus]|uniref:hypothetical protein n=1 Tax=Paenibacillus alginolyticus TaxID=59839 RepID=UPI0004289F5F|nr:hypothetical protein [Paenibacillus alginolyticus]MCY9667022.1 hypothetical protein [Paenibacillus alginolyticus]
MKDTSYNPFNDKTLHQTEKLSNEVATEERAPFNEAIKHGDIVQGFQSPKRLEQFPKWYQNPRRIYATISVLVFASFIIYHIVQNIVEIATGK